MFTITLFVVLNQQFLFDSYHNFTYKPTADMVAVAERAELSDTGKFILYATRPEIEDSDDFNKDCERKEQGTAILGCYDNDRIYIYNVKDERLDGIREVTVAHEMLHAAYQRMSEDERKKINALVETEYAKLSDNPEFSDRMAFYARTEPGERDNELHSIIGTEVVDISPELEKHYAKYITDRAALVALFNSYNSVFLEIDQQAKSLVAQLDALSAKIDTDMAKYNADVRALNEDISDFNRRAAANAFATQAAFNNERRLLQQRVDAVTGTRTAVDAYVKQYEQLREQYNKTITTSGDLYKSIDSSLAPAPKV